MTQSAVVKWLMVCEFRNDADPTMTTATEISWDDLKAMILGLAEQSKETDRRMQETDRRIRALERQLGRLGTPWASSCRTWSSPRWCASFKSRAFPCIG